MTYLASIDGALLREVFQYAAQLLERNKASVDALNVFPVPDGDTGTNMSLTVRSAVQELQSVASDQVSDVADAIARGTLKGARGNSGVILSQLFRGFAKAVSGKKQIDPDTFAAALRSASDMAYRAVMKPKEGTILSVARAMAEYAEQESVRKLDLYSMLEGMINAGTEMLRRTPDLLPVLKEAGVVDSGGQGLMLLWLGVKMCLDGDLMESADTSFGITPAKELPQAIQGEEEIQYAYCTETIVQNLYPEVGEAHVEKLREILSRIGDSVLVVSDGQVIKIHCHSNQPGRVLEFCRRLGELNNIKIENMRVQHRHLLMDDHQIAEAAQHSGSHTIPAPVKENGVVAVAAGEGFEALFKELLVGEVVKGGQTMNPSAEDIAQAILRTGAKSVLVLPNNSNILLAAEAASLLLENDRVVRVVPSKSVPQGIAAMVAYMPEADVEENLQQMGEAMERVHTGSVTFAVRESQFGGRTIHEGNILGLIDNKIVEVNGDVSETVMILLEKMNAAESDLITLYSGSDVSEEEAEQMRLRVSKTYPDAEVDRLSGGQPLYYYLFSVE